MGRKKKSVLFEKKIRLYLSMGGVKDGASQRVTLGKSSSTQRKMKDRKRKEKPGRMRIGLSTLKITIQEGIERREGEISNGSSPGPDWA